MSIESSTLTPLKTYDISFDAVRAFEVQDPEQFASYISSQMETHIGERFNVSLSRYEYDIKNGRLWGKDMNEPFFESLRRGRDYRLANGNRVDKRREASEVVGFEKIEAVLTDSETPDGTMMLSISPPGLVGSTYTHNFYDIFVVKRKQDGTRYVEARRYASSLTPEEYLEKINTFTQIEIDATDIAASFLEQPVPIQNTFTPEDLHYCLHKEHNFMNEVEFERVKMGCRHLIEAYARAVLEQPANDVLHKTLFNTILNKADDIALHRGKQVAKQSLKEEVSQYAFLPVREVVTGCGTSGGYETGLEHMNSPQSVSSYIPDKYGERTFNCPDCKRENVRPYNTLLPQCLHCGSGKVAC